MRRPYDNDDRKSIHHILRIAREPVGKLTRCISATRRFWQGSLLCCKCSTLFCNMVQELKEPSSEHKVSVNCKRNTIVYYPRKLPGACHGDVLV